MRPAGASRRNRPSLSVRPRSTTRPASSRTSTERPPPLGTMRPRTLPPGARARPRIEVRRTTRPISRSCASRAPGRASIESRTRRGSPDAGRLTRLHDAPRGRVTRRLPAETTTLPLPLASTSRRAAPGPSVNTRLRRRTRSRATSTRRPPARLRRGAPCVTDHPGTGRATGPIRPTSTLLPRAAVGLNSTRSPPLAVALSHTQLRRSRRAGSRVERRPPATPTSITGAPAIARCRTATAAPPRGISTGGESSVVLLTTRQRPPTNRGAIAPRADQASGDAPGAPPATGATTRGPRRRS